MSALMDLDDPAAYARDAPGRPLGDIDALLENSFEAARDESRPFLLAPSDLQAVKASGVTFVVSLLERVIEERAKGDPGAASEARKQVLDVIGTDLKRLKPGSPEAMRLKDHLIEEGLWSQYLEVGIGPDAEIFTKAQPMAAVGFGAHIGILPISSWNNPEPEVVVVVSSAGAIRGATLGNDLNLRDVEGRSALLLGKCKDNNASASVGPFIRLIDDGFSEADIGNLVVDLNVTGDDGFELVGSSHMSEISRSPRELVDAAMGANHQYPDGMVLYLGTMFAPVEDRGAPGLGFTHHIGDRVTISSNRLGSLVNHVHLCADCAPWTFGASQLMRNLAERNFI
jgi:fumarylacetoacetate (FAA) hydrolase family protein